MIKSCLLFILLLLSFGSVQAQLKMTKAEARETMSEMAFTVEKGIEQKGPYQLIHYTNTKLEMETILRFNKAGTCDQLITVLPLAEWDKHLQGLNEQVAQGFLTVKPSGKNTWERKDGTTISIIQESNKNTFSIVASIPTAKS